MIWRRLREEVVFVLVRGKKGDLEETEGTPHGCHGGRQRGSSGLCSP